MKIDKRKKLYIIIDTETIGIDNRLVYDLGYIITDKKGNIYKKVNYLVKEIFTNNELMKQAYYYTKMSLYLAMLENGKIKTKAFKDIIKELQADLIEYNIYGIGAYNIPFDIQALAETTNYIYPKMFKMFFNKTKNGKYCPDFNKFNINHIFKKDVKIFDIWTMACVTLCKQATFRAFYAVRGKRFIKSNAEVVYNYIKNTNDFIESHTALSDCLIENEILTRIFKLTNIKEAEPFPSRLIENNITR